MKRILFLINLFSATAMIAVRAQTNESKTVVTPKPISGIVSYVLQKGSTENAEAYLLKPLNLGNQDLPVVQDGWRTRNDGMNHLVAVSKNKNSDVLIFLFNDNDMGVCWLTSPKGELRCAVKFARATHTAEIVPNEKVAKSFELEKT
ncbi:MAG TPA: hypothetical protein VHG89_07310, partial [Verrucomicrobiae bacterium]|nr:hypothetical protein [Verrucomicrobiae bacterium]